MGCASSCALRSGLFVGAGFAHLCNPSKRLGGTYLILTPSPLIALVCLWSVLSDVGRSRIPALMPLATLNHLGADLSDAGMSRIMALAPLATLNSLGAILFAIRHEPFFAIVPQCRCRRGARCQWRGFAPYDKRALRYSCSSLGYASSLALRLWFGLFGGAEFARLRNPSVRLGG